MKYKTMNGLLLAGLVTASGGASAAVTTINFDGMADPAYGGHANTAAPCSNAGAVCYEESGFLFGVVSDATATNHVHQEINDFDGTDFLYALAYHNDSSGVYMRRVDGESFTVSQMNFSAAFGFASGNVRSGFWEILGFDQAANPSLSSGNGTVYANRTAYQTVSNTATDFTNGLLTLNSDFNDADGIKGLWIHFNGAQTTALASGLPFKVDIDNIVVGDVAAVPVPAAVWLFGSGLLGLLSFGRKKSALMA